MKTPSKTISIKPDKKMLILSTSPYKTAYNGEKGFIIDVPPKVSILKVLAEHHLWIATRDKKLLDEVYPEAISFKDLGEDEPEVKGQPLSMDCFAKKHCTGHGPLHELEPDDIYKIVIDNHPLFSKCRVSIDITDTINNKTTSILNT